MSLTLGIDFGTSGARAIARDAGGSVHFEQAIAFDSRVPSTLVQVWQTALFELLAALPVSLARRIAAIAINGTSGTVLLCDGQGNPQTEPLLYHDDRAQVVLPQLEAIAPPQHPVLSATSSLCKLFWWQAQFDWLNRGIPQGWKLLHQADWLAWLLHGQLGISDYHNALKLGYDPGTLSYPAWLVQSALATLLPQVKAPGAAIAPVLPQMAQRFGLKPGCWICAGTTDSIAAFLASGVTQPGEAVTSLGSTLVLKLLIGDRIDDARFGIYSHRLGDRWLVGGASNTGGAVLRQFFSDTELATLSRQIDPQQPSPLDYYPLPKLGERFPIPDPQLPPRLEPRPDSPVAFLQGLLEGIARIEAAGYARLHQLGGPKLQRVLTAGGGAQNATWTALRQRHLQVPVAAAAHTQAAYGTAWLAAQGLFQIGTALLD